MKKRSEMTTKERMDEIWKPIQGYEGYFISNLGRVKSTSFRIERILKLQGSSKGYYHICLCKNKIHKKFYVHRLVASAFLPNPNNLPVINHKDENKRNNYVYINTDGTIDYKKSNLEWCTQRYNAVYGTAIQRQNMKRINGKLSKPVEQYSKEGIFIREYPSIAEAVRVLGISSGGISESCNKRNKICGGFLWKFKDSDKEIRPLQKIIQMDRNGNEINIWDSIAAASKRLDISRTAICNCVSGFSQSAGGFIWRKKTSI